MHPTSSRSRPRRAAAALAAGMLYAAGCAPAVPPVPPAAFGTTHPLLGRIWAPSEGAFIAEDRLIGQLADARIVLLGEQHDNPDHHRLQARVLHRMGEMGRRPIAVFEMIDSDRQQAVDECRDRRRCRAADLAAAAEWNERGWPDWQLYAPVLSYVAKRDLLVVAGGLERALVRDVSRGGYDTLDPELRARLDLDARVPRKTRAAMVEEIRIAHCGHPPEHLVDGMVDAQRLRDAYMAAQISAAQFSGTVALIAGNGHTRNDWAVPTHLARHVPAARVFSIAFVEVREDHESPTEYAELFGAAVLPFDAVWFTARVDDLDPCERFREQLEKMSGS